MSELPTGTVTFLFTDIEGSTRLLHELGDVYADALAEHRRVLREAFAAHGGAEVDTQGDAFFVAFPRASDAVAAAAEAQRSLGGGPIRVRIGLHTGEPLATEEGYVGMDVHRGARIAAAGHGGQVLLSQATRDLLDAQVELRDLGEHRLKDLAEPEWLFQLGEDAFPPLRTIAATNLPRPASSFVGRERELQEVISLLRSPARLVTLAGAGGTGKTRLALEAAAEIVGDYPSGVYWVALAPLRDPALVLETVAQTVGAKEELVTHFAGKHALLLLDNFEQVVEAAPALSELLAACSGLDCLITSREVLRITGEHEYSVPPLAEPEAVELFCERSSLEPDEKIAELCRRLDKLPLAIELAAARTNLLPPAQILERLGSRLDLLKSSRDAETRHATLRTTIAWSYELLSPEEQRLFARLSVFAGGCTLEAAEAVGDADLATLASLVDKSLLRRADDRLWMLETIREFAAEQLAARGEDGEVRSLHAALYRALAEEAEPYLEAGAGDEPWLDVLTSELDNLRASLSWSARRDDVDAVARMVTALTPFWQGRGHLAEAQGWLEHTLGAVSRGHPALRVKVLHRAARMANWRGAFDDAEAYADESISLSRELGDWGGVALGVMEKGFVSLAGHRDLGQARMHFEEARTTARAHHLRHLAGAAAVNLGEVALHDNRLDEARELNEEACRVFRELESPGGLVFALVNLAYTAMRARRLEDAATLYRESLAICGRRRDPLWGSLSLTGTAWLLSVRGDVERGGRVLGAAIAAFEATAANTWMFDAMQEAASRAIVDLVGDAELERVAAEGGPLRSTRPLPSRSPP